MRSFSYDKKRQYDRGDRSSQTRDILKKAETENALLLKQERVNVSQYIDFEFDKRFKGVPLVEEKPDKTIIDSIVNAEKQKDDQRKKNDEKLKIKQITNQEAIDNAQYYEEEAKRIEQLVPEVFKQEVPAKTETIKKNIRPQPEAIKKDIRPQPEAIKKDIRPQPEAVKNNHAAKPKQHVVIKQKTEQKDQPVVTTIKTQKIPAVQQNSYIHEEDVFELIDEEEVGNCESANRSIDMNAKAKHNVARKNPVVASQHSHSPTRPVQTMQDAVKIVTESAKQLCANKEKGEVEKKLDIIIDMFERSLLINDVCAKLMAQSKMINKDGKAIEEPSDMQAIIKAIAAKSDRAVGKNLGEQPKNELKNEKYQYHVSNSNCEPLLDMCQRLNIKIEEGLMALMMAGYIKIGNFSYVHTGPNVAITVSRFLHEISECRKGALGLEVEITNAGRRRIAYKGGQISRPMSMHIGFTVDMLLIDSFLDSLIAELVINIRNNLN